MNLEIVRKKSKLCYDRRSVGQSVLVHPSGSRDQRFVTARELRISSFRAHFFTRGLVGGLQLLLALASTVILGFESRGIHDHILLSQIRDSPSLKGRHIYILQQQGDPVIPPGTGFPFRRFLPLAGIRCGPNAEFYDLEVRTSQEIHSVSITTPNRLTLFREIIAVYCDNHTEHINTLCGQNADL
jgi:hypothetical protein